MSDDEAIMSDDETEEFDEDLFDDDDDDFLVGGEEADEEEAAALNALAQNEQMLMLSQLMCFNNRNRQNQNRASNALAALSFMQGESDDDFEPGDDSDEGDDDDDGDIREMESDSSEEEEEESDLLADEVINDTPVSPLLEQTKTPLQVVAETPTTPTTSSFSPNFIADSTPEIRTTLSLSTPDTTPPNTRRILFTRPATLTQTKSTCNIIDREEVVEAERVKFIVLFKYSDSMQWNTDFTIADTDITGDKVREMVQSELNKRTCHFMIRRLYVIDYDFHGFEVLLDVNESFFETERLEDYPKLICAIINKPTTFT